MAARNPPPEFPVRTYPSPDISDQVLLESITSELANSSPLAPGTAHPSTREFSGFKLGKQVVSPSDHNFTLRFWVKDQPSPDTFSPAWNFAIKYASESDAHPSLIRAYRILKAGYTPLVKGTALADFTSAVLVSEEAGQFPTDSEFYALYFSVVRVYETLPGPWVSDTLIDPDGVIVTVKKRRNLNASITPSESLVSGVWTEVTNTGGDTVVSDEVVKSRAIPGGSMVVTKVEPDGKVLTINRRLKAQSSITTGETLIGGVWTNTYQEDPPVFRGFALKSGNLVAWEIIETRALPGNVLTNQSIGQPSLTPAKYRRLVRSVETGQLVDPAYSFPSGLTGDQTEVKLQQETIEKARLSIISEVIAVGGDPLTGGKTGEFGNLQIFEEVVNEGTPPLFGNLIQNSEVTPFGNGKAIRITVQYPSNIFDLHKTSRSIGQKNLIPEKYRRLIRTVETESPVPVDYTFPNGLEGDQTQIEFQQRTITEARLKVIEEVIASSSDALQGSDTGEWGIESIQESIVNEGTAVDSGYLVKTSRVTPFGNGKAVKITTYFPSGLSSVGLIDSHIDEKYGIITNVTKKIVAAATLGGIDSDGYKEIKAQGIWRSIQFASKIDLSSLPSPLTTPKTVRLSLPDVLIAVAGAWSDAEGGALGATSKPGTASAASNATIDGVPVIQIIAGYRGPAAGTLVTSFSNGVPVYTPSITVIRPSIGTAYILSKGESNRVTAGEGGVSVGYQGHTRNRTVRIGPVLSNSISLSNTVRTVNSGLWQATPGTASNPGGTYPVAQAESFASATLSLSMPASTPTVINSGASIITQVVTEQWRFGVVVLFVETGVVP